MTGTLYAISLSKWEALPSSCSIKLLCVCHPPSPLPKGWVHVPYLAPSPSLWRRVQRVKEKGEWNEQAFREHYTPRFNKEMRENERSLLAFKGVAKRLDGGADIAIACFCSNPDMCHRKLIAKSFEKYGYRVVLM